ncbi:hypothetical protein FIE12Z_3616 [Fusarium flagelliforme]|uniref:Uncharacterized protein n=1 Tax=Fusarium flagelliforme TaxID=2675880 RepID=A0A395MVZ9_9HYPO|nr:hypothetical protein FIE12Z_3616 [Fusarium flagelliforme]
MSIQKLGASLVSQTAEANIGLATFNVDFSIIKLQAPAEYKPLGNELTTTRRMAAEDGTAHVTARKLGALFQDWVPRTPDLIKAYGKRAVEIAQCREVNPRASKADGIFAEHVGIDGTSIWAAATSGPHAIPVYLLACLLARMWSTTEATSIWVELVSERKKELAAIGESDPLFETSQLTSRISLSREDLASWEASARSWLQAADRSMSKKQKQLMLILNNIDLPVSTSPCLVENVRRSWKSAMIAIDSLVKGIPQSVESGAVLLGLSSWHLYPDMIILGRTPSAIQVEQKDELISPAGLLTIGLNIKSPNHHGVYWSLPLSHLRYYGGPVMAERSLATQGNRITVHELFQVAVGSLTRTWDIDPEILAPIVVNLWNLIEDISYPHTVPGTHYWLGYIARAMGPLIDSDEMARKQCLQLMRYGRRHCPDFLSSKEFIPPLFGILNLDTLLPLLTNEEAGVKVFREYAESLEINTRAFIISYVVGSGDPQGYSLHTEYTTALPVERTAFKRTWEDSASQATGHLRWVHTYPAKGDDFVYDTSRLTMFTGQGESAFPLEGESLTLSRSEESWNKRILTWIKPPSVYTEYQDTGLSDWLNNDGFEEDIDIDVSEVTFHLVAGDPENVALYATRPSNSDPTTFHHSNHVSPAILAKSLERNLLSGPKVVRYLNSFIFHSSRTKLHSSLRALATVENIYKMLPSSSLALEATSKPLYNMPWLPNTFPHTFRFSPLPLGIGGTFACIAFFESAALAVSPDGLQHVMAMATSDSIYIPAALLSDPTDRCEPYEMRRIWGNIGRPGIAMLIPPKEPQIRKAENDWRVINHNEFDGNLEDSFEASSLHLGFTEYVLPIDVGSHGNRDIEVYFLESVVSLHDRGTWVADLDVLGQVHNHSLAIVKSTCTHDEPHNARTSVIRNPGFTMVDNWDEMLDSPGNASIVRSKDNWVGRLSAMALSLQLGHPTMILPNRFCWECIVDAWRNLRPKCSERSVDSFDGPSLPPTPGQCESHTLKLGSESPVQNSSLSETRGVNTPSVGRDAYENIGNATWDSARQEWNFDTGRTSVGQNMGAGPIEKEMRLESETLEDMANLVVIC